MRTFSHILALMAMFTFMFIGVDCQNGQNEQRVSRTVTQYSSRTIIRTNAGASKPSVAASLAAVQSGPLDTKINIPALSVKPTAQTSLAGERASLAGSEKFGGPPTTMAPSNSAVATSSVASYVQSVPPIESDNIVKTSSNLVSNAHSTVLSQTVHSANETPKSTVKSNTPAAPNETQMNAKFSAVDSAAARSSSAQVNSEAPVDTKRPTTEPVAPINTKPVAEQTVPASKATFATTQLSATGGSSPPANSAPSVETAPPDSSAAAAATPLGEVANPASSGHAKRAAEERLSRRKNPNYYDMFCLGDLEVGARICGDKTLNGAWCQDHCSCKWTGCMECDGMSGCSDEVVVASCRAQRTTFDCHCKDRRNGLVHNRC